MFLAGVDCFRKSPEKKWPYSVIVAYWRDCRASQALPFDDDLAEMHTAGLIAEGVRQLIKGEAAVQDGAYRRLFERSDIVLLVAPAADHESLQACLLCHQSGRRHFTLSPGQHANQRDMPPTRTAAMDWASVPGPPTSTT
jgi:hypothetical protein